MGTLEKKTGSGTLTYEELEQKVRDLEAELSGKRKTPGDRTNTKDKLQKCEKLMQQMLDTIPDLIWAKDSQGRYLFANQQICDKLLMCNSGNEAIGRTDLYFARRERAHGHEHTFGEVCSDSDKIVRESGKPGNFLEYGKIRGKNLVLDVHKSPILDDDGTVIGTIGCGRDVTKEKETERALLNASSQFLQMASEMENIAVQGYDQNREVTFWNGASEKLYGYSREEALGRKLEDLIIPESMKEDVIAAIARWHEYGEKIPSSELILKHKSGDDVVVFSSHTLHDTANGKEMFCIDIDLMPVKRAEEEKRKLAVQLEKAQRLEAIGTLAGGIAHDFNNILSAIMGYSEIAKKELPADSVLHDDLDAILQASDRAANLVRQILTFSRRREHEKKAIRVRPVVEEAMKMMRSSMPSTIEIVADLDAESDVIRAEPTMIHQVVVNLCTNALQAMKNQKGVLAVGLSNEEMKEDSIKSVWEVKRGPYIVLSVEDNGHGMDETVMAQMFEPYFTTKAREEGTGLGLATVHGIVTDCKGFIQVQSTVGEGTVFRVYLPIMEEEPDPSKAAGADSLPTGNEHILLVDDEIALCNVGTILLSGLGYQVTATTSSHDALDMIKREKDRFDLVISDQTMPVLTGIELARAILELNPDMPIMLYSGYSTSITEDDARRIGIRRVISKPLRRKMLAENVRNVLDGR